MHAINKLIFFINRIRNYRYATPSKLLYIFIFIFFKGNIYLHFICTYYTNIDIWYRLIKAKKLSYLTFELNATHISKLYYNLRLYIKL